MTTVRVKPNQAASVTVRDLTYKVSRSLYQEWQQHGNTGSFDDFMAAIVPQTLIEEAVHAALARLPQPQSQAADTDGLTQRLTELAAAVLSAEESAEIAALQESVADIKRQQAEIQSSDGTVSDGLERRLADVETRLGELLDLASAAAAAEESAEIEALREELAALKNRPSETGLPGVKGEPGKDGQAATITIGSVTHGETASVTNSGTPTDAVLDFVLPRGEQGLPGEKGADGAGGGAAGIANYDVPATITNHANEKLLRKSGVYNLTNAGANQREGMPGGPIGGTLYVSAVTLSGNEIVKHLWVSDGGTIATRALSRNVWSEWRILSFNPMYQGKPVLVVGDSTGELLASWVHRAFAAAGIPTYSVAKAGSWTGYASHSLGANSLTVAFPGGEVAASGATDCEVVFGAEYPNGGYIYRLSNGLTGALRKSGAKWTFAADAALGLAAPVRVGTAPLDAIPKLNGQTYLDGITIICTAKNDVNNLANIDTIKENIKAAVDALQPAKFAKFIICTNWGDQTYTERHHAARIAFNDWVRQEYGLHVFDVEQYLMSADVWRDTAISPTSDDTQSQTAFKIPRSLCRVINGNNDGSHLNDAGNKAVADKLFAHAKKLGYVV